MGHSRLARCDDALADRVAGFKIYVTTFGNYNETYGAIAGVAVLQLWFYVSALAILVGAELNGVIERRRRTIEPPAS